MQKQINQLLEWHKAFEVPFKEEYDPYLDEKIVKLRTRIMLEEVKEWSSAAENQMMVEDRAKELADILYTVFGTIITEGLQNQIERVFDEVHKSNMSKIMPDGRPFKRADGKVLKGPNYKEPDLSWIEHEMNY